jgi:hypothetical protein
MEIEVGLAREPPQSDSGGLRALAACNTRLLAEENSDINLVFSPLPIYVELVSGCRHLGWHPGRVLEFVSGMAEDAFKQQFRLQRVARCVRASASGAMSHARIKQASAFINNLRPVNCHAPSGTRYR